MKRCLPFSAAPEDIPASISIPVITVIISCFMVFGDVTPSHLKGNSEAGDAMRDGFDTKTHLIPMGKK